MFSLLMFCAISAYAFSQSALHPLLSDHENEVTFVLSDRQGQTPKFVLFDRPDQADAAASVNFWRGTQGLVKSGVPVEFRAIRFIRDPKSPQQVQVRLVGIKNEIQLARSLP